MSNVSRAACGVWNEATGGNDQGAMSNVRNEANAKERVQGAKVPGFHGSRGTDMHFLDTLQPSAVTPFLHVRNEAADLATTLFRARSVVSPARRFASASRRAER